MKRLFDSILSILSLVLLLPIFLIIIIGIKITSPGPVFFTQQRIGKDNMEFTMYKFRTMYTHTPNIATHLLSNPTAYITPIGRILRKGSLDELPQLLNILKGDMSFVGPRPALHNQYDLKELRTAVNIHTLLPGLTGWAQINGRDELSIQEKVIFEQHYLAKMNMVFDLYIIFMTIAKVFKREGVSN